LPALKRRWRLTPVYRQVDYFAKLIEKDKLKIKKTQEPNHAKLYIFKIKEQLKGIVATFGLKLAILTCGAEGALMMTPADSCFATPPPVQVINTVGAGDAFTAATLAGLLRGLSLEQINRHANEVAAFVCTQHGAVPILPHRLTEQW